MYLDPLKTQFLGFRKMTMQDVYVFPSEEINTSNSDHGECRLSCQVTKVVSWRDLDLKSCQAGGGGGGGVANLARQVRKAQVDLKTVTRQGTFSGPVHQLMGARRNMEIFTERERERERDRQREREREERERRGEEGRYLFRY